MQISALEVAKLLTTEEVGLAKRGKISVEFKEITPDCLPKTVEPGEIEVARVVEMVKGAPDIRDDIVMQLKERIEKGEYNISGDDIAEMMMRRMRADTTR